MNTIIRRTALAAISLFAAGGLALAGTGIAAAATPAVASSYTLQTAPMTVGTGIGDSASAHGDCAAGFHVRGTYYTTPQLNQEFTATVAVHGSGPEDNDMWVKSATGADHNGGNSSTGADWTYQGLNIVLGNHSWTHSETATVSWTCDPN